MLEVELKTKSSRREIRDLSGKGKTITYVDNVFYGRVPKIFVEDVRLARPTQNILVARVIDRSPVQSRN